MSDGAVLRNCLNKRLDGSFSVNLAGSGAAQKTAKRSQRRKKKNYARLNFDIPVCRQDGGCLCDKKMK